ncbi:RNA-guided endonuclease InsQ/TnpB family protein [Streptomyces sp. 6N223]|uniref:RNA-guided endonuclease InsQ/TnpB family protein n=1 Tax=Streptomyces sp. 6N223 TaxID=3457412 RepID=UPI003FCF17E7
MGSRSATVSRKRGRWYVSFLVEDGATTPERHAVPGASVGIDRGVVVAATTSEGEFFDREFIRPGEAERYRRLQRRLARCAKGSKNRVTARHSMVRMTARVSDRRADFWAQTAHRICRRNALVVLEDLRIKSMTASAVGTVEAPGRRVRQKAGLNRAILDKGWRIGERAFRNAARTTGTTVVVVNPAHTSQTCSRCGVVDANSRESQAKFACTACGHTEHADVNAARIIKAAGLAVSACGDLAMGRSAKQEPVGRATGRNPRAARSVGPGIPRIGGGGQVS